MPDFIAVQCFKCNQYQVSQRRKDSKFNCKLCNAKQSVRKIFAHSDRAADVRKFIQQLNLARGRAEEQFDALNPDQPPEEHHHEEKQCDSSPRSPDGRLERTPLGQSRWQPYSSAVTKRIRTPDPDGADDFDADDGIVTALPDMQGKGRGRKRKRASRQRQGQRGNSSHGFQVGAAPPRKSMSENNAPSSSENQRRYQWGAFPWRNNPPASNAPSRWELQVSGRRTYQWESGMPRMDQSELQPRSNPHTYKQRNATGVPPRNELQPASTENPPPPPALTTALKSDGLLTTLGADEVLQEVVLH